MSYPAHPNPPGPPPQRVPRPQRGRRTRRPVPPGTSPPAGKRRRRTRRGISIPPGCIFGCVAVVGVMLFSMLVSGCMVYDHYSDRLDDQIAKLDDLHSYRSFQTTVIYDRYGNELDQVFGEGRRTYVSLDQISPYLIDATIAYEDDTFYDNEGVDIPSIARAAYQYARYGYVVSGGSTITQQLIRNVLFTEEYKNEQSLNRKADEAILAMTLTQRMSKDEILEMYLNEVYYGNLAYGIEEASRTYFNKSAADLTLGEAALLAALPNRPALLNPMDPELSGAALTAREEVLARMLDNDFITEAERTAALGEQLNWAEIKARLQAAPHFTLFAEAELETLLLTELGLPPTEVENLIAEGGLQVYTTIDMEFQGIAETAVAVQMEEMEGQNMNNAAVIVLQPHTGEILAMVGSADFDNEDIDGNFNVAADGLRQPGSSIKPFVYVAALERGWNAATIIWDTPVEIPAWDPAISNYAVYRPQNYDTDFHGPVTVREALANSYNIPAVQTLRYLGAYDAAPADPNRVVDAYDLIGVQAQQGPQDLLSYNERDALDYLIRLLNRTGVENLSTDNLDNYGVSLALGGGELTPLELTTAYAVLANGGVYVPHTAIRCVLNSDDEIIFEYESGCPGNAIRTERSISREAQGTPVFDPRIAFIISDILADEETRQTEMGINGDLYTPNIPTSVKTGTTNDYRDNWTVGYTRNVVVGVWTGNTDNSPMQSGISGLDGAAPIWNQVMMDMHTNRTLIDGLGYRLPDNDHLQPPPGVRTEQVCRISRASLPDASTDCPAGRYSEFFLSSPPLVPAYAGGPLEPTAAIRYQNLPDNGPQPQIVDPSGSLVRMAVFPLQPDIATRLVADHRLPVEPRYCQVPVEVLRDPSFVQSAAVQEMLFIVPPINAVAAPLPSSSQPIHNADATNARTWARDHNLAILPQYVCTAEMLVGGSSGPSVSTVPGVIASIDGVSFGGASAYGQKAIFNGTATFPDTGSDDFYRLQIRGGGLGPEWRTIGDVNQWPYANGTSGVLGEIDLPPGTYELLLEVIVDSQIVATVPYTFSVG
ncbi:MAG: hypothetical protein GYB65_20235 [Chloroflexi bacterium]|nr:hypothetical protein [Chloroflexota bacterium]